MNEKSWETLKVQYCEHVDQSVNLQAQVIYPPDLLPNQSCVSRLTAATMASPATWMDVHVAYGLARTRPLTHLQNKA